MTSTYTYDPNGNRTGMDRTSVSLPLSVPSSNISYNEANQMLTFHDKDMTYDANGNMTSITNSCGITSYTWDARNRLVGINGFNALCAMLSASFEYDALGRRTGKTINGRTFQYVYDGLDIVQEIENSVPSVNYIRTLNIDEPLARIQSNGIVRYYQADALGSIIDLTDQNGTVKTTYTYDPFGKVIVSGETSDNPFQYTGRENDGTGLYYYRARYYNAELQRFISEDPIGLSGGINKYAYVGNQPINKIDPHGLKGCGPFGTHYPDEWWLQKCCDRHDDCYKECSPKKKCDEEFCDCLVSQCSKYSLNDRDRSNCLCRTRFYCNAVTYAGSVSYLPSCGTLW